MEFDEFPSPAGAPSRAKSTVASPKPVAEIRPCIDVEDGQTVDVGLAGVDMLTQRFVKWFEKYDHRIRARLLTVHRVLKTDVLDLAQDFWFRVWKQLHKGKALKPSTEEDPWPWFKAIIKSVAGEYHRNRDCLQRRDTVFYKQREKSVGRRRLPDGDWEDLPAVNNPVIGDAAKKAAIDAVHALGDEDRAPLIDRFWNEKMTTEMALEAGIHRKAAERKVTKALRLVGTRLDALHEDVMPHPVILKCPHPSRPSCPHGAAGKPPVRGRIQAGGGSAQPARSEPQHDMPSILGSGPSLSYRSQGKEMV